MKKPYEPSTEEVREAYWYNSGKPSRDPSAWLEFDTWLRRQLADAWWLGVEDHAAGLGTWSDNPYLERHPE